MRAYTIYVCPRCGSQHELRLKRLGDYQCYGLSGSHPGTTVEAVQVVPQVDADALLELIDALGEEESEHGFPFSFRAREALRQARAALDAPSPSTARQEP